MHKKCLYCSGWLKKGPIGVITTTMNEAFETGKSVVDDLISGDLTVKAEQQGCHAMLQLLHEKGVDVVSFEEWQKIDRAEVERGKAQGKVREKIVNVEDMLGVAKS
ncbi:hypothetical protein NP493_7g06016 [Ridgeia piscesae]|uniref:Uncharacterized protein n=1 Tax=Ridgeia piscesae TaxID=27915 RepID=A0AAD9PFA5_RIDPI|nr:hypothetical protein NP493_7g06016 [Ridgeia piscesae]